MHLIFRTFASVMQIASLFQLDILDFIFKGMIIGMLASAPMGPVGILCINRTMKKGRWYGFVTGVGAAVSDLIYALMTGLGMSFVMNFVNNELNKFILQIVGSLLLLAFGIYSFMSNPKKHEHHSQAKATKGTLLHNGLTAFLLTFSNPLIIFLFIAAFAQFAFVVPGQPVGMVVGYMSIVGGALLWWYGLTWLIDKVRDRFDDRGVMIINRIIGSLVIIASLLALIGTIFNIYLLPHF